MSTSKDIADTGNVIGKISVQISYRIIDLFSGHLYSSPAKAIEELVVNSYDAFANVCHVYISEDLTDPDARILVFDDGDSMDETGLKELWLIAETPKREKGREQAAIQRGRPPIGKFGIGKLASYVVGRRISHLCRKDKKYLLVTMDYSKLPVDIGSVVELSIRQLSIGDVQTLLQRLIPKTVSLPALTGDSYESWTLVVIDQLKSEADEIKLGRLGWIISTALPLDPSFRVYLNSKEIEPSKLDEPKHNEWIVGDNDAIAEELKFEPFENKIAKRPFNKGITIPGIGKVSGKFELYKDTLTEGKSAQYGRSHGFFIVVRGRLVNLDEALFGLSPLAHQTLNRFRGVVYADGLDNYLVSSREDLTKHAHGLLERYLTRKFYEARNWYEKFLQIEEKAWPETLANIPGDLVKYPLVRALDRSSREKFTPTLIRRAPTGKPEETTIKEIELKALEPTDPVGVYDSATGTVMANVLHPFRSNFPKDDSFKNWATVEVVTEAYLLDAGLDHENAKTVMEKRDRLMRVLVRSLPVTASTVAMNILETTAREKEFEAACERGFKILGMDVTRLGGSGKPDGVAAAPLGLDMDGEPRAYTLVYDAKTTGNEKVKAGNLKIGSIARHRKDYKAQFAVIIAPDYEGEGDESAAVKEAKEQEVTLIRAKDFADLLEASSVKPLPLTKLKELFAGCRSPDESQEWVTKFRTEPQITPPIKLILETIWELQKDNPRDPVSFGAIKFKREKDFKNLSERDMKAWLESLQKLVPGVINVSDKYVALNQSPDVTIHQLQQALERMRDQEVGKSLRKLLAKPHK